MVGSGPADLGSNPRETIFLETIRRALYFSNSELIFNNLYSNNQFRERVFIRPMLNMHSMEKEKRLPIVGFVTAAYTILLLISIMTGNDDIGELWFGIFPIFLIFVIVNLLLRKESANAMSGFVLSILLSLVTWIIIFGLFGDPWGWEEYDFFGMFAVIIIPAILLYDSADKIVKDAEKVKAYKRGILISIPFCIVSFVPAGMIYF